MSSFRTGLAIATVGLGAILGASAMAQDKSAAGSDPSGNSQANPQPTGGSTDMPATKHQEQVLQGTPSGNEQVGTAGDQVNGMPATKHQEEVLRSVNGQQTQETQEKKQ